MTSSSQPAPEVLNILNRPDIELILTSILVQALEQYGNMAQEHAKKSLEET